MGENQSGGRNLWEAGVGGEESQMLWNCSLKFLIKKCKKKKRI